MSKRLSREQALARIAVVDAEGGNVRAAARVLGIDHACLMRSLRTIKEYEGLEPAPRYVTKGVSTLTDANGNMVAEWNKTRLAGMEREDVSYVPDPRSIKRTATLVDQTGKVSQQWVIEEPRAEARRQLWEEFAVALAGDIPRVAPTAGPARVSSDFCAVYPVGDHHIGMYSWAEETGGDYDLGIAESLLAQSMNHLVSSVPSCETALIAVIGDFLHYDSTRAETPLHKNMLDADGRAFKMVQVAVRALRQLINAALEHHATVHLILEPGNHDPHSTTILSVCLDAMYENEPRLIVDTSPRHFHYFEWGANLIGTHHGHGVKMEALPGIMAADQAPAWGRTVFRHWFTGHIHHKRHHDLPGCSVESLRILPPLDAHAAQHGYRSARGMVSIILHKLMGEVARYSVNPLMFGAA
jgi:hypothetical protein